MKAVGPYKNLPIEALFDTFCSTIEFRFVGCSILTNENRGINDGEYDLLGVMTQIRLMYNWRY